MTSKATPSHDRRRVYRYPESHPAFRQPEKLTGIDRYAYELEFGPIHPKGAPRPITETASSAGVEAGEHVSTLRPGAEESGRGAARLPGDRSQGRGTKEAPRRGSGRGHETADGGLS